MVPHPCYHIGKPEVPEVAYEIVISPSTCLSWGLPSRRGHSAILNIQLTSLCHLINRCGERYITEARRRILLVKLRPLLTGGAVICCVPVVFELSFCVLRIMMRVASVILGFLLPTALTLPHNKYAGQNFPKRSEAPNEERAQAVIDAFRVSWDGYYKYAFPNDELRPVTNSFSNSR